MAPSAPCVRKTRSVNCIVSRASYINFTPFDTSTPLSSPPPRPQVPSPPGTEMELVLSTAQSLSLLCTACFPWVVLVEGSNMARCLTPSHCRLRVLERLGPKPLAPEGVQTKLVLSRAAPGARRLVTCSSRLVRRARTATTSAGTTPVPSASALDRSPAGSARLPNPSSHPPSARTPPSSSASSAPRTTPRRPES